jgi:hypothetical protein
LNTVILSRLRQYPDGFDLRWRVWICHRDHGQSNGPEDDEDEERAPVWAGFWPHPNLSICFLARRAHCLRLTIQLRVITGSLFQFQQS